jgi:hypothetical protein
MPSAAAARVLKKQASAALLAGTITMALSAIGFFLPPEAIFLHCILLPFRILLGLPRLLLLSPPDNSPLVQPVTFSGMLPYHSALALLNAVLWFFICGVIELILRSIREHRAYESSLPSSLAPLVHNRRSQIHRPESPKQTHPLAARRARYLFRFASLDRKFRRLLSSLSSQPQTSSSNNEPVPPLRPRH